MNYYLSEISAIVGAQKSILHTDDIIRTIYIDTRQISIPQNALFLAIESSKNDGHRYLDDAFKKGVRNFIVRHVHQSFLEKDANFIVVTNTVEALQKLAAHHRKQFNIPIIGITGSNGKTIVKEWLYFLLKDEYNICRSPKSFNSQIGVPLSVLNLNQSHELALFEAGISLPNEMSVLEKIIQPHITVLTHFGNAHSENFLSEDEKLSEKLKLFSNAQICIIQRYHNPFLQQKQFPASYICISENKSDFVFISQIEKQSQQTRVQLVIDKNTYSFSIPFIDDASIANAITCFVTIFYLDKNLVQKIIPLMKQLPVVSLRMEVKKGKYQSIIINDYYNSDIDSFEISMSYFRQYASSHQILILSDFEQVKNADEVYLKAQEIIHQYQLFQIILIGKEWQKYLRSFCVPCYHYPTTADFIDKIFTHAKDFFGSIILIKGARKFEFEKIAQILELKTHDTVLEVNIPALWNNLQYYKNLVGKDVKLMCMLKASGYGSGSVELAYALQKFGVDYIAVAYTDEAVELKQANILLPIMVMLPERSAFRDIIQHQLEPEIYSFEILKAFVEELERQGIQQYPVHIKLDTGMHRLGFLEKDIPLLCEIIKNTKYFVIKSIFSHLAASENDEHNAYTLSQIQKFEKLSSEIQKHLPYKVLRHICNSAAVKRFPQAHFDMVRLGIGMYGITEDVQEEKFLQNVLTLKTNVAQVKQLKKSESVGYNRSAVLEKDTKVAVIPIGYADGFMRSLGNKNFSVKYKDRLLNTIGNICMDMTMIDATNTDIQPGDEIIVFDSVKDIKRMAKQCRTIPYEILTSISQRVKRVYVYE